MSRSSFGVSGDFNPRTREGCDPAVATHKQHVVHISIHAPVKGATGRRQSWPYQQQHFNPRTREGCDDEL